MARQEKWIGFGFVVLWLMTVILLGCFVGGCSDESQSGSWSVLYECDSLTVRGVQVATVQARSDYSARAAAWFDAMRVCDTTEGRLIHFGAARFVGGPVAGAVVAK
jgi:hypothetical protein